MPLKVSKDTLVLKLPVSDMIHNEKAMSTKKCLLSGNTCFAAYFFFPYAKMFCYTTLSEKALLDKSDGIFQRAMKILSDIVLSDKLYVI